MTKATVIRARGMVTLAGEGPARGEQLFAPLRRLDDENVKYIFSEAIDAEGVGLAVMNRLGRAAAFHIVPV